VIRPLAALALIILLAACASSEREPRPNLSLLKADCVAWHDSGAYDAAFARAADPARRTLEHYLRGVTPQNFAIVFDIDETLLSNWPYLRATQFALQTDTFTAWIAREHGIPLAPTQALYAKAHAYQIPIFLVTGRSESMRAATIRDLEEAGYWGWKGLYMKPDNYADASIIPFKSGVRKMLTEQGWDIILNVGDQDSDLAGGYARHRVKLPNPFYFIP
jgi:predicted secreted acid phosphatase